MILDHIEKTYALKESGQPFVIATLTGIRGGAPQELGAKILVGDLGLLHGTIGGGKIEARVIVYAQELLKSSNASKLKAKFFSETWNLQKDIGMSCGGEVTVIFEVVSPPHWKVVVFGAGHVSQALVRLLLTQECQVQCVDSRAEWLAKLPESPKLLKTLHSEPEQLVSQMDPRNYFVVMTQGHATDRPILKQILNSFEQVCYVGCMGSDVKALKMRKELAELGVSESKLKDLKMPIGLKLGNNTPAQIAVSVTAQLLEVYTEQS